MAIVRYLDHIQLQVEARHTNAEATWSIIKDREVEGHGREHVMQMYLRELDVARGGGGSDERHGRSSHRCQPDGHIPLGTQPWSLDP